MKNIPLTLLILLTSCQSFLFCGNEMLTELYVQDRDGCRYEKAKVFTIKTSRISVRRLAFYVETSNDKIWIPKMIMDEGNNYIGRSTDGVAYVVTYILEGKNVTVRISNASFKLLVSTHDICNRSGVIEHD